MTIKADFLQAFERNITRVVHALKQQSQGLVSRKQAVATKQWYFLLGDSQVGKSGLSHDILIEICEKLSDGRVACQSWITADSVIIECPGELLAHDSFPDIMRDAAKFIKRKARLDGVIVCLNTQNFVSYSHIPEDALPQKIKGTLDTIAEPMPAGLPVHVVFSHVDVLAGFADYFQFLNPVERKQVCGFVLPKNESQVDFSDYWREHYAHFIQKIRSTLGTRLQQARTDKERALSHQFPLQLESMQNVLGQCIAFLMGDGPGLLVRSIYFMSLRQDESVVDRLSKSLSQVFTVEQTIIGKTRTQQTNYFNNQIVPSLSRLDKLRHSENVRHTWLSRLPKWRRRLYPAALMGIAVAGGLFLTQQFNHNLGRLQFAESALQQIHLLQSQTHGQLSLSQLQPTLDLLQKAEHKIRQINHGALSFVFPKSRQVEAAILSLYQGLIDERFIPVLADHIKQSLQDNKRTPAQNYSDLKAYLMLGQQQHLDINYLTHYLQKRAHVDPLLSDGHLSQLLANLQSEINQAKLPPKLDTQLITRIRTQLNILPKPYLVYLILKNRAQFSKYHALNVSKYNNVLFYTGQEQSVPYIFTRAGFKNIYEKEITSVCRNVLAGDWVLGESKLQTDASLTTLAAQVRTLYLADYVNWWNLYLYNTNLASFTHVAQARELVTSLTASPSPIEQFLKTIKQNTKPVKGNSPLARAFNNQVAREFSTLNHLSKLKLSIMRVNLKAYALFLKSLKSPKAIFESTKNRFNQAEPTDALSELFALSKQYPAPLKGWLNSLAANTWYVMVNKTHQTINQQWNQQVYQFYAQQILNRYPFDKDAKKEVSISAFSDFFAENGLLNSFTSQNLIPFVDTRYAEWHPKKLNGLGLPFSKSALPGIQRARILSHMFFPNKSQTPQVSFSLKPEVFEPIVKSMHLSINGQSLNVRRGHHAEKIFMWPGNRRNAGVQLSFEDVTGKKSDINLPGPWAWFRLLDAANLKQLHNTQAFQLIFNLQGSAVKYKMLAQSVVNPFIPNVIAQFSLPTNVLVSRKTKSA
jgi:intracellular multiplication protein IcmF